MTSTWRSEYVGFKVDDTSRVYTVRVSGPDGAAHEFQIAIANRAFLSSRVRYQDGAEICFWKLKRELSECDDGSLPASNIKVTDIELDEYRARAADTLAEAYEQKSPDEDPSPSHARHHSAHPTALREGGET